MTLLAAIMMLFGSLPFIVHDVTAEHAIVEVGKIKTRWVEFRMQNHNVIGITAIDGRDQSICIVKERKHTA